MRLDEHVQSSIGSQSPAPNWVDMRRRRRSKTPKTPSPPTPSSASGAPATPGSPFNQSYEGRTALSPTPERDHHGDQGEEDARQSPMQTPRIPSLSRSSDPGSASDESIAS